MGGARRGAAARGSAEGPRRPRTLGSAAQLLPPSPGSSFRNRSDTSLVDYARTTVSQPPERGARCSGAASESVQPGAGVHLVWSPSPGKDAVRPRTPGDRGQGTGDGLPSRHHPPPRWCAGRWARAGPSAGQNPARSARARPRPCPRLCPRPHPRPRPRPHPRESRRRRAGPFQEEARAALESRLKRLVSPSVPPRVPRPLRGFCPRRVEGPLSLRRLALGFPRARRAAPGLGARARRGPQRWGPFGEKSFALLKATKASHVAHPAPSCPGSVRGEDAAPRGGGPWADSLRTGRLGFTTPAACVVSLPGRTFTNVLRIRPAPRLSPDRPLRFPATAPNSPGSSFGERGGRRGGAGAPAGAVAPWRTPPPVAATDGVTGRGWGGDLAGCRTYLRLPQRLADSDAVRGHVSGAKGADRGAASRLQRTQRRALPGSALGAGWL